jgi:hypothetical protein
MPELSRFLGIVIAMYYRDHAPPHFHAIYGDYEATIDTRPARSMDSSRSAPSRTFRSGGCCIRRSC